MKKKQKSKRNNFFKEFKCYCIGCLFIAFIIGFQLYIRIRLNNNQSVNFLQGQGHNLLMKTLNESGKSNLRIFEIKQKDLMNKIHNKPNNSENFQIIRPEKIKYTPEKVASILKSSTKSSKNKITAAAATTTSTNHGTSDNKSLLTPAALSLPNICNNSNIPYLSKKKKLWIAYAITITKDGFFQDGAAVLAYSIIKQSNLKAYDISFIAFVHPNVTIARPFLKRLGFHVIEAPTPVNTSAIRGNKFLREKIDKNGCCGATELIKLYSYRLIQFDRIVHLDADVMLINPIDELFACNQSLIYTTDPNMATHKGELYNPVQGGFLVLRPSVEDYQNIISIIMNVPFYEGGGWNGSKIGWYWGGMTIQGVLAYYYKAVTVTSRAIALDRCIYNTMADTDLCSKTRLHTIKSAHFTVCQKPWGCWVRTEKPKHLCGRLHLKWFDLRSEAEVFYNIKQHNVLACDHSQPTPYKNMKLEMASLPKNSGIRMFDAPSRMEPLPGAGFINIG